MEAMEGEKMVHIIDLHSFEAAQWINLLQALSSQPGGPPHLKITGIHEQNEVLEQMAHLLSEEAEKLDIPFQFIPIIRKLEDLDVESLPVKVGEALAVRSVVQMHSLLAYDDKVPWRNLLATPNDMGTVHSQKILDVKEELVDKDLINATDLTLSSTERLTSTKVFSTDEALNH
ncbi:Scarecrow-like protein 3 [Ancistrocladus abbreviatus]